MVQTRSAAKRTERAHDANANDGGEKGSSSVGLVEGNNGPPPAKKLRRENAVATKKRRRGKAVELCQLNLDVLFLIASYIHPLDLLNLARTCKSLRELLMDSSSTFIWKAARQQVKGLPRCPDDLTEPEYANLVFYDRCHGCDRYMTTILWNVRHRYCSGCRIRRLRPLSSCNEVIRNNNVLPTEHVLIKKEFSIRVDRDQAAAFMEDYRRASNKEQFIIDRQARRRAIYQHTKKCEAWQEKRGLERKEDKKERQLERRESIFQRLEEHGYSREIGYFGYVLLQERRESDFRSSKPLTNKEWERMLPEWVELMKGFRLRRLETVVYDPRRRKLELAYDRYVERPSSGAPTIELLPPVIDVVRFPPFREIIKAPEETLVNDKSFTSAFAQLPVLAAEWKEKLDAELAQLVGIPHHLCSGNVPGYRGRALPHARQSSGADIDRLHLACAVFRTSHPGAFNYLEVLSVSMSNHCYVHNRGGDTERSGSVMQRFGVRFLQEAPSIVHACGLDPRVATVNDMDSRNARLKCLSCEGRSLVMDWRHAMSHASRHEISNTLVDLPKSPRWQLISDKHIDAIQAAEQSLGEDLFPSFVRCLFCKPRVGDVLLSLGAVSFHMRNCHDPAIERVKLKQGVHYAPISLCHNAEVVVEMVEEGGQVTFTAPSKQR